MTDRRNFQKVISEGKTCLEFIIGGFPVGCEPSWREENKGNAVRSALFFPFHD